VKTMELHGYTDEILLEMFWLDRRKFDEITKQIRNNIGKGWFF